MIWSIALLVNWFSYILKGGAWGGQALPKTYPHFRFQRSALNVVAKGQLLTKIIADIIVAAIATTIPGRVTLPQPASYPPKNL
jgi:hypothetical protein